MQNKLTATWILVAFLVVLMGVYSLVPAEDVKFEAEQGTLSSEQIINQDSLANSTANRTLKTTAN